MRFTNATPLSLLSFERRTPADERLLVVVAQGVFAVGADGLTRPVSVQPDVALGDEHRGDPKTTSLRREGALATFKPRSDLHLDAVAHAPGGIAREGWPVRICVGDRTKDLAVRGPSAWTWRGGRWQREREAPCTEVPLTWERAFGGAHVVDGARVAEERNPLGTGFLPPGIPTDGVWAAPQVLRADEPEHRPGERYDPQGVAPLGRDTAWRLDHAGTYDDVWRRTRWPRLPDDFDMRFYNSAHPDLVYDGYLRGDERVELVNLDPGGTLRFALPGLRAWLRVHGDEGGFDARPLHLDTLHLDVASPRADDHRLVLTWRACLPMTEPFAQIDVLGDAV
jgi:hypothetical protein